ncbi:glycosyltransferase family 4 protein [Microvirga guangxiensis]|nr:glycosyltransferase family 4 protein [Microvirga guangxiensis]
MRFDYNTLDALKNLGVVIRPFRRQLIEHSKLDAYYNSFIPINGRPGSDRYIVFNDGVSNFEEVDLLLIASDHIEADIPPHQKYGMLLYDYVQRYHPHIYNEDQWSKFPIRARVTSKADFVLTTTQQTRRDAISYAGVDPNRAFVLPIEFDAPATLKDRSGSSPADIHSGAEPAARHILWPTIVSAHENHSFILDGLEHFLQKNSLKVKVTGFHTGSFDPKNKKPVLQAPHIEQVRSRIKRSSVLQRCLSFEDYVEDHEFWDLMENALCVLHSSTGDNGSYTILEGAWLGTPTLSSRYPAMEEVAQAFDLRPTWFSLEDPSSLSRALDHVFDNFADLRSSLPSRDALSRNRYDNLATKYWREFSSIVKAALQGTAQ